MILGDATVQALGDRAVMIKFNAPPSRELTERLMGISFAAAQLPGVLDASPGLCSVLIELAEEDASFVEGVLAELIANTQPLQGVLHEVPTRYNGPDFAWALSHLDLAADELIRLHSGPEYDVRLLGSPGFVYLSNVIPALAMPRLETPRKQVAAGSVGIAGTQAGIYGRARPGGWRIIATTSHLPQVRPGDRVRFVVS